MATLGALVKLPGSLAATRQFMGMLDSFGLMNSTLPRVAACVPWALYSLNTRFPFRLAARESIESSGMARRRSVDVDQSPQRVVGQQVSAAGGRSAGGVALDARSGADSSVAIYLRRRRCPSIRSS